MKVGNRTVLAIQTVFIRDGEFAELEVSVPRKNPLAIGGGNLKLKLSTSPLKDYREPETPVIRYELVADVFEFVFSNFNEPLGSVTNNSTQFAQFGVNPIFYFAAVYRLGGYTKIELQITMGEVA